MRAKNLVDLLTLSVSLYMLSKDEEFLKDAAEMTAKGKQKAADLYQSVVGKDNKEIIAEVLEKAAHIKDEMLAKADEIAANVYKRMHITHTDELRKLAAELDKVKTELALAEARIVNLESRSV